MHRTVIPEHDFIELAGIAHLDKRLVDFLYDRSYLSGHFSVFYQSQDQDFLEALCRLYPPPGKISEDNLAIRDEKDQLNLSELLGRLTRPSFLISFPSEADFLAIFADHYLLEKLVEQSITRLQ